MQNIYKSDSFGGFFWLDDENNFKYCATDPRLRGDWDYEIDYVVDWDSWDSVDVDKLLNIHRSLVLASVDARYWRQSVKETQ
jgi:hypothetical protein